MNRTEKLKKQLAAIVTKEIKYIEGRARFTRDFIKSTYSKEELENPDTIIKMQEIQIDLYNNVYKPWMIHLESLRSEILKFKDE